MTKTKRVLALLADGAPMESKAIAKATGWDMTEVTHVLSYLKTAGFAKTEPFVYAITEKGMQRHQSEPSANYQKRVQREKAQRIDAEKVDQSLINLGREMPNSVFHLGSQNA